MKKISCFFLFLLVFWIGCQDQPKVQQQAQPEQKTDLPLTVLSSSALEITGNFSF